MIEIKEWHNQPILHITDDSNPLVKVTFGLKKARLILRNLKDIEAFVQNNLPKNPQNDVNNIIKENNQNVQTN